MLILIEESGVNNPTDEVLYTNCKTDMKHITHLTSCITSRLEIMCSIGINIFQGLLDFDDLKRKHHQYYNMNHPVKLILPYLDPDVVSIYINSFPKYEGELSTIMQVINSMFNRTRTKLFLKLAVIVTPVALIIYV